MKRYKIGSVLDQFWCQMYCWIKLWTSTVGSKSGNNNCLTFYCLRDGGLFVPNYLGFGPTYCVDQTDQKRRIIHPMGHKTETIHFQLFGYEHTEGKQNSGNKKNIRWNNLNVLSGHEYSTTSKATNTRWSWSTWRWTIREYIHAWPGTLSEWLDSGRIMMGYPGKIR